MIVIEVTLYRCNECHIVVAETAGQPLYPCPKCDITYWEELIVRDDD